MPSSDKLSLSILVMTYNEEARIERCLTSCQGLGEEILLLDSFSTDSTVEIAKRLGARVEQFPFDTYVHQKSRMVQMADSNWVLCIDADEYLSDELKMSIQRVIGNHQFDGYTTSRRNKIGNRWMNHGSWYPDRKIRLFDRRKVFITGKDPHDVMQPVGDAKIGHLKGDLMHDPGENISSRYQKVNAHSSRAAEALLNEGKKWSLLRIIFKPLGRFITSYFIRLGMLDGYYGWVIAQSEAHYVWLREIKLWEIYHNSKAKAQ